jgi:hypothetical protein
MNSAPKKPVRGNTKRSNWLNLRHSKPDYNGIRHEPILADPMEARAQVSDGIRQSARILQAGGRGFESP